ncbi:12691_t:CDS:2, partial [Gigaspora margarita]
MEKLGTYRNIFVTKGERGIEKNKEVLIITECDVSDYSTEEIKGKIMQAKGVGLAKQDDLTERIIANIKQIEVYSKMEVDINTDNKTKVVDKTSNKFDKVEDINSSIWAQASKSSQNRVKKAEIDKIETITGSDYTDNQAHIEFEYGIKGELRGIQIKKKRGSKAYMSLGWLISKIKKTDHGVQINFIAELNRKCNSLVKSYREQNLRGESETKRKRNQEEQRMMLASLLEKLFNKIRLNRVLVKEDLEYKLAIAPFEVLLDTKDYFKGQFRERYPKIECMTKNWREVYSPVNKVQENWYNSTLDLVELEEWQNMLKEIKAELVA